MPFLELSIRCRESEQPRYERALEDLGALAVTLLDADATTTDEQAILEPGVGETPLWDRITLIALFPADADESLDLEPPLESPHRGYHSTANIEKLVKEGCLTGSTHADDRMDLARQLWQLRISHREGRKRFRFQRGIEFLS